MCGIVGFTGTQNAAPVLLDGLSKLEYRGYDSAGIAVVQGNRIAISKVTGRIQNLREKTEDGRLVPGTTGIGHTRWATHGAPNDINAHPHASNDGKFAVVHNGIIENYMELREELVRKGYHFESETDTEVIVHLIEMYYAGDFRKAVMKASSRLVGSYALGIVCTDAPDTVLAVREASPLILGVGIGENFFASDVGNPRHSPERHLSGRRRACGADAGFHSGLRLLRPRHHQEGQPHHLGHPGGGKGRL